MNFNGWSVKVSMRGFQACYGKRDLQVLWYHHRQDRLLILNHRSSDIQEDDSFYFVLFQLYLMHLLIKASLCPFLFNFFTGTYQFLLTFSLTFLTSQQKNHRCRDSFSLTYQVLKRIIDHRPFLLMNPPKALIIVTTQLTLTTFLKCHLKLDVFNQTTLIQQSTIFVNQYFQALILWFIIKFQDLLAFVRLLPKVTQEIIFNLRCLVLSPQWREPNAVLILLEEIFLEIVFQEECLNKDYRCFKPIHHPEEL